MSACHASATGNLWEWWQTVQVNTFFRGKDLDVQPKGICHIRFPHRNNEHITFRKVWERGKEKSVDGPARRSDSRSSGVAGIQLGDDLRPQRRRWQAVGGQRTLRGDDSDHQRPVQLTQMTFAPFPLDPPTRPTRTTQYGESRVVNHATGYYAVLQFRPYSFLAGVVADVEGKVFNKNDEPVYWIKGNWNRDCAIAPTADGPWTVRRVALRPAPRARRSHRT